MMLHRHFEPNKIPQEKKTAEPDKKAVDIEIAEPEPERPKRGRKKAEPQE